ncbi:dipeptidyl aminopeptidase/acylaminoacyl peptidase [Haloferula luteola]|uniref:Dipeptidyl aminopeptidase/acylaminoacyl peptidase n=1 Tax=Haloferula luteola TaxID=595692 RepID=A0A840V948_9BACT|nr:prolyl oligopeptidase family serine peptidase [Haloferula luteola]MBB5350309.1 dipeptidyl aminopeptidase/acylaminoacyl peptidase [Haloferula luteola]
MKRFPWSFSVVMWGLAALGASVSAESGGLKGFEEVTGKWYQVARTAVPNESVRVAFAPDDQRLVQELEGPDGKRLVIRATETGEVLETIDPGSEWSGFRWTREGLLLETPQGDRTWTEGRWSDPKGAARREAPEDRGGRPRMRWDRRVPAEWRSPNGEYEVAVRDGDLVLSERGEKPRVLVEDDKSGVFRDAPVWSPDGSRFAIWKTRDVKEREVHYIDSAPDGKLQPEHFTQSYPKPGDEIDTRAPWVFFIDGREPLAPEMSLIPNPYECDALAWRKDSQRLTYEYVERGFGKQHVIEINSETRVQRALIQEDSDTFVFVYGNSFRRDLDDGEEILWMSERDGWKHLFLLNGKDGSVIRNLTEGEWIVREVVQVDEEKREVLLKISGREADQDPYFIHYARVSIDTGKLVPLTSANGTHDRFERSSGGSYYTCRWSRVDHPPVTELHRWSDGALISVLAEGDDSALRATGWPLPEPFVAKDRDGKFDIWGIILRPPNFDPTKKYPVVENIYAGPQDSFVPKAWNPWMAPMHEVAVNDFIVVKIDGRGTANRSREFHHFCYKNLKDAGFPDRIAWMKAAAKKEPAMDLDRVGIFGGSAGGQNALGALLFHGDFYKAAVADCGCHDNRMDKIWWNEQWMDWPVGPEYADNSNVTHAKELQGALLLTVGELDTNVDPSSTYQVIDALIDADKDFEFLPFTGKNHGAGEARYGQRRRVDFFERHLGQPIPAPGAS